MKLGYRIDEVLFPSLGYRLNGGSFFRFYIFIRYGATLVRAPKLKVERLVVSTKENIRIFSMASNGNRLL